jgi:hypothetical protein
MKELSDHPKNVPISHYLKHLEHSKAGNTVNLEQLTAQEFS